MTTTVQKRMKEHKRQEKQKAKAEVRRNKSIARREENNGRATADANTHAATVTDAHGHDIENPT